MIEQASLKVKGRLRIQGGRVIDPSQGLDKVCDLVIAEGRVADIQEAQSPAESEDTIDARGLVVCPGFVDLHCHLREPGFEDRETIATGTMAAAAGGFTTVCAMANTDPVPDTGSHLRQLIARAEVSGHVRVRPLGSVTKGLKGRELAELADMAQAGAVAFSDDGRPVAEPAIMRNALAYAGMLGRPVVSHCEDPGLSAGGVMNEGWVSTWLGLRGAPAAAEETMLARDLSLVRLTGGRLHVAHVSTRGSVELIRQAKSEGVRVTAEVTPHHLALTEEWVAGLQAGVKAGSVRSLGPRAYDTNCKVNPPLRTYRDVEALLQGLEDGTIDAIATDHAPHRWVDKECEFGEAAFGISGLETALGILMGLVDKGFLNLLRMVERLTTGPCEAFGLPYGTLRVGAAADVAIFDRSRSWIVDPQAFYSLGRNTPLAGQELKGKVLMTLVGGRVVNKDASLG